MILLKMYLFTAKNDELRYDFDSAVDAKFNAIDYVLSKLSSPCGCNLLMFLLFFFLTMD